MPGEPAGGPATPPGTAVTRGSLSIPLNPHRLLRWLLAVVAGLLVASFLAQLALRAAPDLPLVGFVARALYIDTEQSIPTALSFLLLLACAGALALVATLQKGTESGDSRHWAALSVVFVALAFDEHLAIHEEAIEPMRAWLGDRATGLLHFAWVVPGLAFASVVALFFLRFTLSLPRETRNHVLLAGFFYLAGAVLVEMVGGAYVEDNSHEDVVYLVINSIEEGLEMAGATVFFFAITRYIFEHYGGLTVAVRNTYVASCQVGDAAGGWAADGGVVPMMVVAVEPTVKGPGSAGV